jgi:site-specific recombinase XerD
MPTPNISAFADGTMGTTDAVQRGACRVTVPFPPAWEDDWDSYEYVKNAEGQSPKSIATRRTSILRLAKQYPDTEPAALTRKDIERHITTMRKTLRDQTVYGSFQDLRTFFGWLAADRRTANIMEGMKCKTAAMTDVPVLSPDELKTLLATCQGDSVQAFRDKGIILMFLETGLRRQELTDLMMSDVSVKECTAYVRRGKGSKPRIVIFGEWLVFLPVVVRSARGRHMQRSICGQCAAQVEHALQNAKRTDEMMSARFVRLLATSGTPPLADAALLPTVGIRPAPPAPRRHPCWGRLRPGRACSSCS